MVSTILSGLIILTKQHHKDALLETLIVRDELMEPIM